MGQNVLFNNSSLEYLTKYLKEKSPKNILLVTGKKSYITSGAQLELENLLKDYSWTRFFDFEENPKLEDVQKGVNIFNKDKCDFIVAIGGGSVMDMAKLINYFNNKSKPYEHHLKSNENADGIVSMAALPTTAGSGSESTHFAVVYHNKIKYSIANPFLLPEVVCIIPKFTYKINNYLTAVTSLDALSQAVESFWSIHSNDESLIYAREAIEIIWEYLPAVTRHKDVNARGMLCKASNLAGKAINITKTTAPHAFSYFLTQKLRLSHGHAVAITLPFFCKYNYEITKGSCNDKKGIIFVRNKIISLASIFKTNPIQLCSVIKSFIIDSGLEVHLERLGITKELFFEWKSKVNTERLKNNPRKVSGNTWIELENYFFGDIT